MELSQVEVAQALPYGKNEFAPARRSPEKFRFALYRGVDIPVPDFPQGEDENFLRTRTLWNLFEQQSHSAWRATSFGGFRNPGEDNNKLIPLLPANPRLPRPAPVTEVTQM